MPKFKNEITKGQALALVETKWWENKNPEEIVRFQLFTDKLCMPWSLFHKATEEALGRPVWTHEFGLAYEDLCREFLGEKQPPTMEEIFDMVPKDKIIISI